MHPRMAELFTYLDQQHVTLVSTVATIPPSRVAEPPAPDRWSVAQVLEHLVLIEQNITKLLAKLLAEAKERGLGAETDASPVLPRIDTALMADRSHRVTSPGVFIPTTTRSADAILGDLDHARREFKQVVMMGDGLALGEIVYPHRVLGPLDMYAWIAFTGAHMGRHTDQIREVGTALTAS